MDDLAKEVESHVVSYPDFPKPGILFRDIMPVFQNAALVDRLCRAVANNYREKIDAIAALEARGFLFGPQIAINLKVPFVPLRKRGKLPGPLLSISYLKEYGTDVIELQEGALKAGQRVLLVDDLLATGGTIGGAIQLVHMSGARVTHAFFVVELTGLGGRARIADDIDVRSLLKYD